MTVVTVILKNNYIRVYRSFRAIIWALRVCKLICYIINLYEITVPICHLSPHSRRSRLSDCDKKYIESFYGLLKIDLLSLRTLDAVSNMLANIEKNEKIKINFSDLFLNSGQTV